MLKFRSTASKVTLAAVTLASLTASTADAINVRGKVVQTQGHITPNCREVVVRRADNGSYMVFRIAATGQEDGVLANALTALTTGFDVVIWYDPSVTTGCGTEPAINWIELHAPGAP